MYIRRFTYKKEDVGCKLCTEFRGRKKCPHKICPYIPCWSARWPCIPESPPPIEPAGIRPGSLVHHPFKSPFAPISQIAEGQLFEIWEYYLIFERGWVGGWLLSAYHLAICKIA